MLRRHDNFVGLLLGGGTCVLAPLNGNLNGRFLLFFLSQVAQSICHRVVPPTKWFDFFRFWADFGHSLLDYYLEARCLFYVLCLKYV